MMTRILPFALASAAVAVASHAAADTAEEGEAELAELLEGGVPTGEVSCLSRLERRNMRIIDNTAIVFETGDTIYVNRPGGVQFLGWNDVPVFEVWGGNLCRGDRVVLTDRSSGIAGPHLVMNAFQTYSRPEGEQP